MKKVILTVACLVSIATISVAQEGPKKGKGKENKMEHAQKKTVEQRAQMSVDELTKKVALTEEQKPKVYDLALTRAKSVDAIREKYKGQPENKETAKKEIEAVRKTYRQSVKGILTPEQIEKIKAARPVKKGGKANKAGKVNEEVEMDLGGDND